MSVLTGVSSKHKEEKMRDVEFQGQMVLKFPRSNVWIFSEPYKVR